MTTESSEAVENSSHNEPRVLNKRFDFISPTAVYVGRPSKWGNPFSHLEKSLAQFQCISRNEAIQKHREWFLAQPDLIAAAKAALRGRDLICWCSPKSCHADILLEVANS